MRGLLGDHRLVEVVGPGGIGKTALAIATGRTLADVPVWLVRLEAAQTADDVLDTVIAALGIVGGEAALRIPALLLGLMADLATGLSLLPIRLISLAGALLALLGVGFGLYIACKACTGSPQIMFSALMALILFVAGLQLLALGLIGEYVGRACMEVRQRPRYVIQELWE